MILMDTHILLWFHQGNKAISPSQVKDLCKAQQKRELFLSAISVWEIAMLEKLKKVALNTSLELWLRDAIRDITILPIDHAVSLESVRLPYCEHKDPADRFIIATARIHNLKLATHDQKIIDYATLGYVHLI